MPRRKKNDFLDLEIYHFSRRESAPYRNPVEMYAYILSNYISLSNQTYCIGPRSSAYLVACNEPDEDHRVGDGKCDYLAPQQDFSNFQQYSEQRVINAILVTPTKHLSRFSLCFTLWFSIKDAFCVTVMKL